MVAVHASSTCQQCMLAVHTVVHPHNYDRWYELLLHDTNCAPEEERGGRRAGGDKQERRTRAEKMPKVDGKGGGQLRRHLEEGTRKEAKRRRQKCRGKWKKQKKEATG